MPRAPACRAWASVTTSSGPNQRQVCSIVALSFLREPSAAASSGWVRPFNRPGSARSRRRRRHGRARSPRSRRRPCADAPASPAPPRPRRRPRPPAAISRCSLQDHLRASRRPPATGSAPGRAGPSPLSIRPQTDGWPDSRASSAWKASSLAEEAGPVAGRRAPAPAAAIRPLQRGLCRQRRCAAPPARPCGTPASRARTGCHRPPRGRSARRRCRPAAPRRGSRHRPAA
jgi:hypothetical protein